MILRSLLSVATSTNPAVLYEHVAGAHVTNKGWRRPIGGLKLQVIFHKRATNYRALLRTMTYKDKASYGSLPPCTCNVWMSVNEWERKTESERQRVYKYIYDITNIYRYIYMYVWYIFIRAPIFIRAHTTSLSPHTHTNTHILGIFGIIARGSADAWAPTAQYWASEVF